MFSIKKNVLTFRYENITIGLDLDMRGEVGYKHLEGTGQTILILCADKLTFLKVSIFHVELNYLF